MRLRTIFPITAAALTLVACGEARSDGPASTVTVRLPPPRPAESAPGFSFAESDTHALVGADGSDAQPR